LILPDDDFTIGNASGGLFMIGLDCLGLESALSYELAADSLF
jgi:hypothetical protein